MTGTTLYRLICCYEAHGISPLLYPRVVRLRYNPVVQHAVLRRNEGAGTSGRVPFHICHLPYYVEDELHETLRLVPYERPTPQVGMIQWAQKTFDPDYVSSLYPRPLRRLGRTLGAPAVGNGQWHYLIKTSFSFPVFPSSLPLFSRSLASPSAHSAPTLRVPDAPVEHPTAPSASDVLLVFWSTPGPCLLALLCSFSLSGGPRA